MSAVLLDSVDKCASSADEAWQSAQAALAAAFVRAAGAATQSKEGKESKGDGKAPAALALPKPQRVIDAALTHLRDLHVASSKSGTQHFLDVATIVTSSCEQVLVAVRAVLASVTPEGAKASDVPADVAARLERFMRDSLMVLWEMQLSLPRLQLHFNFEPKFRDLFSWDYLPKDSSKEPYLLYPAVIGVRDDKSRTLLTKGEAMGRRESKAKQQ